MRQEYENAVNDLKSMETKLRSQGISEESIAEHMYQARRDLNKLGKIFDKDKILEKQELAKLFGEEIFKTIGDLGLKDGSPEKTVLDAFAGGIMSKLGGSSFVAGAAGAGINEVIIKELGEIRDPAVMQWASAAVGGQIIITSATQIKKATRCQTM